jgi:hypothetical protein
VVPPIASCYLAPPPPDGVPCGGGEATVNRPSWHEEKRRPTTQSWNGVCLDSGKP